MAQTKAQLIDGKGAVDLGAFSISGSAPDNSVNLDSSGRLLVGTSSSLGGTGSGSLLQAVASGGLQLALGNTATSYSADTLVSTISFHGNVGGSYGEFANIQARCDGASSSNSDVPGRLVFSTTADGASSPTERMRITSGGQILANLTATIGADTAPFQVSGGSVTAIAVKGGSNNFFQAFYNTSNTLIGSITGSSGASTAFNTGSDYRLKENVTAVTDGITRLQQLKPSRFNFIADPGKTVDGFIAHEVQTIVPEAITGEKDAVDDDGNPIYQGIDQSKLVPLLTAALQEAIGRIEQLEAAVTALQQS